MCPDLGPQVSSIANLRLPSRRLVEIFRTWKKTFEIMLLRILVLEQDSSRNKVKVESHGHYMIIVARVDFKSHLNCHCGSVESAEKRQDGWLETSTCFRLKRHGHECWLYSRHGQLVKSHLTCDMRYISRQQNPRTQDQ
jgi:hypothetical protein